MSLPSDTMYRHPKTFKGVVEGPTETKIKAANERVPMAGHGDRSVQEAMKDMGKVWVPKHGQQVSNIMGKGKEY